MKNNLLTFKHNESLFNLRWLLFVNLIKCICIHNVYLKKNLKINYFYNYAAFILKIKYCIWLNYSMYFRFTEKGSNHIFFYTKIAVSRLEEKYFISDNKSFRHLFVLFVSLLKDKIKSLLLLEKRSDKKMNERNNFY